MAKDPAMLWYWGDWFSGTATFSRHLKGCYMDILNAQFNSGHLSLDEIKTVLGSDFGSSWPTLQKKFSRDPQGLYFNERLDAEKEKRKQWTESRKNNLKSHKATHTKNHMVPHMENENINDNVIEDGKRVQGETTPAINRLAGELDDAMDEIYLSNLKAGGAYSGIDIDDQAAKFRSKVQLSPRVYATHGMGGLRLAFAAQLRSAKPTININHEQIKRTAANAISEPSYRGFGKL